MIDDWIDDPDHPLTEAARHSLELYGQLNDSEFAYVTELQGVYDQTRCFFLQWILGKEIKELVNSARISAVQSGNTFTWVDARAETLKSMTDVTLTARFLALSRLKRQQGTTAKLWISQVLTRKALLEDSKLRAPINLPECLYLELLVGQMSAQETTVFDDCPAIGDDLLQTDASGRTRFTLDRLKRAIDACSNPPYFRGVSTPVTELLDAAEPKVPKQKRDQQKHPRDPSDPKKTPWKDKGDGKPKPHLARRPDHEKPTNLPEGLKRPNLDAIVDGKKIASEAQRQLYDDVKRGQCTRCHKGDHNRKDCKDPKAKWEDKFDKEGTQYWASVLKWQLKSKGDPAKPAPTLHAPKDKVKFVEQRYTSLSSDSDDEQYPVLHYRMTIDDLDEDTVYQSMSDIIDDATGAIPPEPATDTEMVYSSPPASPPTDQYQSIALAPALSVAEILASVELQLHRAPPSLGQYAHHPPDIVSVAYTGITPELVDFVRLPHNFVSRDTLAADPFFTVLHRNPDYAIVCLHSTGRIASCFPHDVDSVRSYHLLPLPRDLPALTEEYSPESGYRYHRPPTPRYAPDTPPSPPASSSVIHEDISYDHSASAFVHPFRAAHSAFVRPPRPQFSTEVLPHSAPSGGNNNSDDEDYCEEQSSSSAPPPHSPFWGSDPALPVAPNPNFAPTQGGWQQFQWATQDDGEEPEPDPQPWGRRRPPSNSSSESDKHLQSYAQAASSFRGGTTVNAIASVRDPSNPRQPLATRSILLGLDSYSDVTVAHRDIVYNVRAIHEQLSTGGGATQYYEEGLVDIVDGPCSFRTVPALVANHPTHLPSKCLMLLGVPQINELDIKLDTHRRQRRLPLESYDPTLDFQADTRLQCFLSEKDLVTWAAHHHDVPVGTVAYSHLDVIYCDTLTPDEIAQLRAVSERYKIVFIANKGGLPALANHPPVTLNFKEGWKHVSVPLPKWGPGAIAVLSRWAQEMLDSGLYVKSKSPSASRPHIVRKYPPNAPKDVDITQCGMRVCGDYRKANDQLQKSFPSTANGTDELAKLPGYSLYWWTDRFSMYNAYALEPGPSRELLAIHTPLGLLEPTRMVFGEMNAGTVACASTPAILRNLPDNAYLRTASYVDDHAQGAHTFADLLKGYADFLALCEKENWNLNATKTMVGFPKCNFFGFKVDKTGTRLADKNLDPIRRMVPPTTVPELRMTLGVFVQSSRFIPNYAHIVRPLTELTRSVAGKPVPFIWTQERQQSFDHVRNLLLDGIHLAPPDYRLPFHSGGDASNDGKAYGIFQFNDLPANTQFKVESHCPDFTTVRLTDTDTTHTIPHNTDTRHNIAWFSKVWSDADRKRAPFYLEADTLLWGLAKCRFWALSSPFPLYASSDHLPLKWVRKCEKGPVSEFTIEQLSDLEWVHSYIPGPDNVLFDALSRYPLLGPRVLAPVGLSDAVTRLLEHLPDSLQTARKVCVFAPPHTQKVAQQVQAWRQPTNPINVHSITHTVPPSPDTELIITMPRAEDAPRIAARLLTTKIPFAILVPSDLAPRIAQPNQFESQPDLAEPYTTAGKIMFLDSDHLWIMGNIPSLQSFSKIYSQVLTRPSPLLELFGTTLHPNLPSTLMDWKHAQDNEPEFLQTLNPESLAKCNGLTIFKDPTFPSRILVPPSLREALIRQHHADLQHVSHTKVHTSLARYYFWPSLRADTRRVLEDCEHCENEKAKRRLAHGLFSSNTTDKPRSRYAMDFQGQGIAVTGETEALAIIDSFTKIVTLIPLPDRQAQTLVPKLMDALHFQRGSPDIIHSDDAPEFLSELMTAVAAATGTLRTTTCGHNPQSNGEIESWWRFWNRAMRFLSPSDYLNWPRFAQRICFAYSCVPHDSIGGISPFEMDHGTPPTLPFAPPDPNIQISDLDDSSDIGPSPSPEAFIAALRISVDAFHRFAATHKTFMAQTTQERLNKFGTPAHFALDDRVKIYVPPTHAQLQRTGRRSNHIVAWRGPCRITKILSDTAYEMVEECSKRTFQRTIVNIRPFRATKDPPPPHHDLLSSAQLVHGTIVAVRDTPHSPFHLAKVLSNTENHLSLHYLGTTNSSLDAAVFRLLWTAPDQRTVLRDTCPARNHLAVTGEIDNDAINDLLVASHLTLTSTGRLSRKSARLLFHLRDQLHIY
jgi:transposase InsO family protein